MGMDLVPVYADEAAGEGSSANTIKIDPTFVQNIGVQTTPVKVRTSLSRSERSETSPTTTNKSTG